jgi:hypothetical protein
MNSIQQDINMFSTTILLVLPDKDRNFSTKRLILPEAIQLNFYVLSLQLEFDAKIYLIGKQLVCNCKPTGRRG